MTATATKSKPVKKAKKAKKSRTIATTGLDYSGLPAVQRKKLEHAAELVQTGTLDAIQAAARAGKGYKIANEICTGKAANEASAPAPTFRDWCKEVGKTSKSTAYRQIALSDFIEAHPALQKCSSLRALYLLSATGTDPKAQSEAARLAEKGEDISEEKAQEIVNKHSGRDTVVPAPKLEDLTDVLTVGEAETVETIAGAAAESNGNGKHPPEPIIVNDVSPMSCPRGGSHEFESDGHGDRFCIKCHEPYSKKEHGGGATKAEKAKVHSLYAKFVRAAKEIGVLPLFLEEANKINVILRS